MRWFREAKEMIVYRGSGSSELAGKSGGVWVTEDEGFAAEYGEVLKYKLPGDINLLGVNSYTANDLANEFWGEEGEDSWATDIWYEPPKEFLSFLKGKGYEGFVNEENILIFDKAKLSRVASTKEIFKLETETNLDALIGDKPYEGGGEYADLKDYMARVKGLVGEIFYMTPDEYLEKIPTAGKTPSSIEYMKSKIAKGEKLPMPWLDYSGSSLSQEGRNRAYLAKELGIDKIPVLVVNKYGEE